MDAVDTPVRITPLKADTFGRILLLQSGTDTVVRRDLTVVPRGVRWLAHRLAAREARALAALGDLPDTPRLLGFDWQRLDRSYLPGAPMFQSPPHGNLAWFRAARRLLQQLHRRGIVHNDLAKEANWLVQADGRPALIDFQLAMVGRPRSRWFRLLAREDLRHLLKHKRTYCPDAITPVERRLLNRRSWVRQLWFATGKPVYRFITRKVLHWRDNEGRGPRL